MTEEIKDVKPETAPVQSEETAEVSEDVKTPEVVDKSVYEKVREAMQKEREAKRLKDAENAELRERLARLETPTTEDEEYDPYRAKTDILFLMNKDPFIKDNLDLIEQKMTDSKMDVASAVREVKAEFFDRIQKEVSAVETIKPPKQEKPAAIQEEVKRPLSGNMLEDAVSGKIENIPTEQMIAIKRVLGR